MLRKAIGSICTGKIILIIKKGIPSPQNQLFSKWEEKINVSHHYSLLPASDMTRDISVLVQSISSAVFVCRVTDTAGCRLWSESQIKGRQNSPYSDSEMSPCLKIQLFLFSPSTTKPPLGDDVIVLFLFDLLLMQVRLSDMHAAIHT